MCTTCIWLNRERKVAKKKKWSSAFFGFKYSLSWRFSWRKFEFHHRPRIFQNRALSTSKTIELHIHPTNSFASYGCSLTEGTEAFLPPTPYSYSLVLLNPSWTLLLRIRWGGKWLNQPIQGKWRRRNRGSQEEAISIDRDLNLVGNQFYFKTSSSWFSSTFSHPLLPWLQCMEGHVVYNVLPLEAKLICWFINHLIQKAETPKQEATILLLSFFLWLCLSSSAINFVFVRLVSSCF